MDNYDGFDPKSAESHIIFSLFQNAYRENSMRFAQKVESQFKNRVSRKSRGIKEAGFVVEVDNAQRIASEAVSKEREEQIKWLRKQTENILKEFDNA